MHFKNILIENKKIHYRDEGSGEKVLVLLHGFMNSLDVWNTYVLYYMREIRVISIDLPGHGKSDVFLETHSMDFMARIVKLVLDELNINQCVMLGHSMGGYVSLAFASKYPHQLKGMGLLHSHAMADDEKMRENRFRACELVKESRAGYIVKFIPELFAEDKRLSLHQEIKDLQELSLETSASGIIAAQKGMAARESRLDVLNNLLVPIFFVYGKKDIRIPLEIGVAQAMSAYHAEILILTDVGHMSHLECPSLMRERIKAFVNECYCCY